MVFSGARSRAPRWAKPIGGSSSDGSRCCTTADDGSRQATDDRQSRRVQQSLFGRARRAHRLEELNDIEKIEPDGDPGEVARHHRCGGGVRTDGDGDGDLDRSERRELDVVDGGELDVLDRRRELVVVGSQYLLRSQHFVVGGEHVVDRRRGVEHDGRRLRLDGARRHAAATASSADFTAMLAAECEGDTGQPLLADALQDAVGSDGSNRVVEIVRTCDIEFVAPVDAELGRPMTNIEALIADPVNNVTPNQAQLDILNAELAVYWRIADAWAQTQAGAAGTATSTTAAAGARRSLDVDVVDVRARAVVLVQHGRLTR